MKTGERNLWENLEVAVAAVRQLSRLEPEVALVLGTGLGDLGRKVKDATVIPYEKIPHFPLTTAESHKGQLLLGTLGGKKVAVMEGRFHAYEGYSLQEVAFPIRVLARLGAKILAVTNAAGGMNLEYKRGDIILIEDHINFMGLNPLIGPNDDRLGPRFPDMSRPYAERLLRLAEQAAGEEKLKVRRGVYVAVPGPNLETRAEYRFLRGMGADLVGMSTVPEVLVGVQMGLEVLGAAVVTDVCDPDHLEPVDIKEIIRVANEAGPRLDRLLEAALRKF